MYDFLRGKRNIQSPEISRNFLLRTSDSADRIPDSCAAIYPRDISSPQCARTGQFTEQRLDEIKHVGLGKVELRNLTPLVRPFDPPHISKTLGPKLTLYFNKV
jgi:hypothetical protein